MIDSTVGLALTDPWVHFAWAGGVPDMTQVDGPVLILSGTGDGLTSQGEQQNYYDQVPGPAAKAAAVGKDHGEEPAVSPSERGGDGSRRWRRLTCRPTSLKLSTN